MKKIISLSFAALLLGTSIGYASDDEGTERDAQPKRLLTKEDELMARRMPTREPIEPTSDNDDKMFSKSVPAVDPVETPDVEMGNQKQYVLGPVSMELLGKTKLDPQYLNDLVQKIQSGEISDKEGFLRRAKELEALQEKRNAFPAQKMETMETLGIKPVTTTDDDTGEEVIDQEATAKAAMASHYTDMFKAKKPSPVERKKSRTNFGAAGAILDFIGNVINELDDEKTLRTLPLARRIARYDDVIAKLTKARSLAEGKLNPEYLRVMDEQLQELGTAIGKMKAEQAEAERFGTFVTAEKERGFMSKIQSVFRQFRQNVTAEKEYVAMMAELKGESVPAEVSIPARDAYRMAVRKKKAAATASVVPPTSQSKTDDASTPTDDGAKKELKEALRKA